MDNPPATNSFEHVLVPHLDAAYNLARWMTGNDADADDVVQEAFVRALTFFGGFHGGDARPWLLAIVRNTCRDWMRRHGTRAVDAQFDEDLHTPAARVETPESLLIRQADRERVLRALESLPIVWREVLVLRELEGLSYKEIAEVVGIPLGTVMSRLARARSRLQVELATVQREE